jgi:energy-coupling factor transport system permease protein
MSVLESATRIAYRRRASPLHATRATVAAAYGAGLALAALLVEDPIVLAGLLVAVLLAAAAAGVGRQLLAAARGAAVPMFAATVIVNVLVDRGGLTVFARLGDWGVLGQMNLTVESVVFGLVFGLRLLVVALACLLAVCTADPDEMLVSLRRISPRSALTASLATRMVPVLGQDAQRLAEALRCRPDGGPRGTRARLAILRATIAGALDRALDVAAVLETRGYGASARARVPGASLDPARAAARSRHDLAFGAAAVAIPTLALLSRVDGAAAFHAYPLVSIAAGPGTFATIVLLIAAALLPFADRRGIEP